MCRAGSACGVASVRIRAVLLATGIVAGMGVLARPGTPKKTDDAVVVVPGPALALTTPARRAPAVGIAPIPVAIASGAATPSGEVAEDPAAEVSDIPKDYAYWDGAEPGVWATPAEFSATD